MELDRFTFGAAPTETLETFVVNVPSMVYAKKINVEEGENGSKILTGVRIFKVGTFADSLGREKEWEAFHLDQMVFHFNTLRDGGYLPNVPIRADHSFSVKDVVGYFKNVYRDTEDDNFLAADLEITEPDAYEKWRRGTWRSRSVEVGHYTTNDGKEMFPVIRGLAFVDLPAVEGLHRHNGTLTNQQVVGSTEENDSMATETKSDDHPMSGSTSTHSANKDENPAPPFQFKLGDKEPTADYAAVQAYVTDLESRFSTIKSENEVLKQTIATVEETARTDFIDDLFKHSKIVANQVEPLKALVVTMTAEQFQAYRAVQESAPESSTFSSHGEQNGGTAQNPEASQGSEPTELQTQEEIVDRLYSIGMSKDKVEKTEAYQRLITLRAAAND